MGEKLKPPIKSEILEMNAPKIEWEINEEDALDRFSLISLIHRRLDNSN